MENVTISVLNECWKRVVLAQERGGGQKVQRIRESPPPPSGTKEGVWGGRARRSQTEMRMVPALNIESLILDCPALFLSFYLLDMGSG